MKGYDSISWPVNLLDDLVMTENVTSDDLHDRNNYFFLSHVKCISN